MHQPADGLHALGLHRGDHRLTDDPCEAGSLTILTILTILTNIHDHQVPVRGEHSHPFLLHTFMSGYRDDLAIIVGDHDASVEGSLRGIVPPGDESVDDLDDLVQPRCP